jgi:hypothetical protein
MRRDNRLCRVGVYAYTGVSERCCDASPRPLPSLAITLSDCRHGPMTLPVHSGQESVSMTRSTKTTFRIAVKFEIALLKWEPPLRNRTVDLLLTMATPTRPQRAGCTDCTPERTESTECTRWTVSPVHDSVHDEHAISGRQGNSP